MGKTKTELKKKQQQQQILKKQGCGSGQPSTSKTGQEPTEEQFLVYVEDILYDLLKLYRVADDVVERASVLILLHLHLEVIQRAVSPIVDKPQFKALCNEIGWGFKMTGLLTLRMAYRDICSGYYEGRIPKSTATYFEKIAKVTKEQLEGEIGSDEAAVGVSPEEKVVGVTPDEKAVGVAPDEKDVGVALEENVVDIPAEDMIRAIEKEVVLDVVDGNLRVRIMGENKAQFSLYLFGCGKEIWIKASIERVEDECLSTYISNLMKLRGDPHFIRLEHVFRYEDRTCLLVDRYNHNLDSIIKRKDGKSEFWVDVKLATHYELWRKSECFDLLLRPSPFFQHILREIVAAMVTLYDSDIAYDLSLTTIVFSEDDEEFKSPKLRHIFSTGHLTEDKLKLMTLFKGLKDVIRAIMLAHGVNVHNAVKDVKRFIQLLEELNKSKLSKLIHYPVMWHSPMKLRFYIKWQKAECFQRLTFSKKVELEFVQRCIFPNWTVQVMKHPYFEKKIRYAEQKQNKIKYVPMLFSLMEFIRDMQEHLNEKMVNVKDEEGKLVGDDFEKEPNIAWTEEDLDTVLEFWCPMLAEFLIEFTPEIIFSIESEDFR